jgi:hypothetical protein
LGLGKILLNYCGSMIYNIFVQLILIIHCEWPSSVARERERAKEA